MNEPKHRLVIGAEHACVEFPFTVNRAPFVASYMLLPDGAVSSGSLVASEPSGPGHAVREAHARDVVKEIREMNLAKIEAMLLSARTPSK